MVSSAAVAPWLVSRRGQRQLWPIYPQFCERDEVERKSIRIRYAWERAHRKIIATEFGPLGGRAASSISWRANARAAVVLLSATIEGGGVVVVFRVGGNVAG